MSNDEISYLLQRFERIESKLDKLTEVTLNLARVEERMSAHMDGIKRLGDRIDRIDVKIEAIDRRIDDLEQSKVRFATIVGIISGAAGMIIPTVVMHFFQ